MTRKSTTDTILSQILSCLDAGASRPGLVRASVHQTEGYLRGLQGLEWQTPAASPLSSGDPAEVFLHAVRTGAIALRGRMKRDQQASADLFLKGLSETFPKADKKPFTTSLSRLWVRWEGHNEGLAIEIGRVIGTILKQEYDEGVAGDLSAYILDERLHLRNTSDYLRMRGWLKGMIQHLRDKPDWESRSRAEILKGNFSSIILRCLHNANVNYAAEVVEKLPLMTSQLDQAISNLAAVEPEASHFLRKNRSTVLTRALHSGYLDYPEQAAADLPKTLKQLHERIGRMENESPEAARDLRSNVSSLIYRALTNGKLGSI